MPDAFSRERMLLGEAAVQRLRESHVIVFGLGGVGSFAVEALARAGVGELTLVDHDTISITNLNRQLYALHSTLGRRKVDVARERVRDINPDCNVHVIPEFYLPEHAQRFWGVRYSYIVDAIDTVSAKIDLACRAREMETPIIASMGTGNKLDPSRFEVADLYETQVCPLCRVIIQNLKVAGGKGLADGQQGQALIGIDRLANLYVVFCITVVTVVLLFMFARSRYGRAVKAIRDDEIAAGASGINITYMKVLVFAISAFFAGIAGGIFAQYIGALTPSMAGWLQSINYVIMVVFGGMGSLTGSIVAAVGLTILPELLRAFSAYRMLVYSVVLVIIMVFRPQGLFGSWEFSLPKFVNKWFYPVRVKMHGKSGASQSVSKKTKETGETAASSEINTSSEDKEVQA